MSNYVMNVTHENFRHLLHRFNQPLLSQQNLEQGKEAALRNCWEFVDGTVHKVYRPNERILTILYNEHKREHDLKFQSVVVPNGLIVNLYGPVKGRRHNSGILAESNLLPLLQQHSHRANGSLLCIYCEPTYPLRAHLERSFEGNHFPQEQEERYQIYENCTCVC